MTAKPKPLPCPVCGREPEGTRLTRLLDPIARGWVIRCDQPVKDASRWHDMTICEPTKQAAITAWNALHTKAPPELDTALNTIAAAYQIVAALAHHAGVSDHPEVIRALDALAYGGGADDLLPWPRTPLSENAKSPAGG